MRFQRGGIRFVPHGVKNFHRRLSFVNGQPFNIRQHSVRHQVIFIGLVIFKRPQFGCRLQVRASGNRRMEGASLEYLALIRLEAGDVVGGERAAREALAVASAEPVLPLNQAESNAILARALLAADRGDEALSLATLALDQLEALGGIDDGEAIIRLTLAEALAVAGDRTAAALAIGRARDRLLHRADAISDPALRASFIGRVPENARTLALAVELGA